jgi:hypothetical protein
MRSASIVIGLSILLTACGGGGGDDSPSGPPITEGAYGGSLTGSAYSAFQLLVLDGGEYWAMYGDESSSQFFVAGFVQGTGSSDDGTFSSGNARDFIEAPAVRGTLSATYTATPTVNGTVSNSTGSIGFSGGAIAGSLYNYSTPATIATVAGAWSLQSLTGETVSLNIGSGGTFNATASSGCNFSGTVVPRPSGKNVFNVSLTFAGAPCALPGTSGTGIAVAYPLATGHTQLIVAVKDAARDYGTAAFGIR